MLETVNRLSFYAANVFRILLDLIADYCPILLDGNEPLILFGDFLLVLRDLLCICHGKSPCGKWG